MMKQPGCCDCCSGNRMEAGWGCGAAETAYERECPDFEWAEGHDDEIERGSNQGWNVIVFEEESDMDQSGPSSDQAQDNIAQPQRPKRQLKKPARLED
ncbi:hypothetical protein E3N88_16957 [Mikania micrantha]|uniref:Uncharacterized protein n=1 Tax=Mikania micrantha TaxID=192012 RepID=A0A5N6NQL1_9ASTR|nr:hypothetical protein E3N88_16957 [Mikania micrantha]